MMIQTPTSKNTKTLYRSVSGTAATATSPAARTRTPSRIYRLPTSAGNGVSGNVKSNGFRRKNAQKRSLWSPLKLIIFSVLLGIAGSLYLTHVFQTQNTLREVQRLRQEYERVHRIHADARRNYVRMTGPAEVYRRAESLGMVAGGAADPMIIIER